MAPRKSHRTLNSCQSPPRTARFTGCPRYLSAICTKASAEWTASQHSLNIYSTARALMRTATTSSTEMVCPPGSSSRTNCCAYTVAMLCIGRGSWKCSKMWKYVESILANQWQWPDPLGAQRSQPGRLQDHWVLSQSHVLLHRSDQEDASLIWTPLDPQRKTTSVRKPAPTSQHDTRHSALQDSETRLDIWIIINRSYSHIFPLYCNS